MATRNLGVLLVMRISYLIAFRCQFFGSDLKNDLIDGVSAGMPSRGGNIEGAEFVVLVYRRHGNLDELLYVPNLINTVAVEKEDRTAGNNSADDWSVSRPMRISYKVSTNRVNKFTGKMGSRK